MDIIPLEDTAREVRLIRVPAPQPLEGGLFVSKSFEERKRERVAFKGSLRQLGNRFFDFNGVHASAGIW